MHLLHADWCIISSDSFHQNGHSKQSPNGISILEIVFQPENHQSALQTHLFVSTATIIVFKMSHHFQFQQQFSKDQCLFFIGHPGVNLNHVICLYKCKLSSSVHHNSLYNHIKQMPAVSVELKICSALQG